MSQPKHMGQLGPRYPELPLTGKSKAVFFSLYSAFSEDRDLETAATSSSRREQYQEVLVDKGKTRRKLTYIFLPLGLEGQKAEVQNLKASSTSISSSHEETPP